MVVVVKERLARPPNDFSLLQRQRPQIRVVLSLGVIPVHEWKLLIPDARRHHQQVLNGNLLKGRVSLGQFRQVFGNGIVDAIDEAFPNSYAHQRRGK